MASSSSAPLGPTADGDSGEKTKAENGIPVDLLANCFPLKFLHEWEYSDEDEKYHKVPRVTLMEYSVHFPLSDGGGLTPTAKRIALAKLLPLSSSFTWLFDGNSVFTPQRIPSDLDPIILSTAVPSLAGFGPDVPVVVSLKSVGEISSDSEKYLEVVDLVFRSCLERTLGLSMLEGRYMDPEAAHVYVQSLPGFRVSIHRSLDNSLVFRCDAVSRIFRTDTALDVFSYHERDIRKGDTLVEELFTVVCTKYRKRLYKICSIDRQRSPKDMVLDDRGVRVPLFRYYADKYGATIKDLDQFLFVGQRVDWNGQCSVDKEATELLVPELCTMTGVDDGIYETYSESPSGEPEWREVDDTLVSAEEHMTTLRQFAKRIIATNELSKWGLELSGELMKVSSGKLLPPQKIIHSDAQFDFSKAPGWSLRNFRLLNAVPCQNWAVLYPKGCSPLHPNDREEKALPFIESLVASAAKIGFSLSKTPLLLDFEFISGKGSNMVEQLVKILEKNVDMFVVVEWDGFGHFIQKICYLPSRRAWLNLRPYEASSKRLFPFKAPVLPMFFTEGDLRQPKDLEPLTTKIAVQMATMLGAEPWSIHLPLGNSMIIGFYGSHFDETLKKYVGAFVSTTNATFTRFYSSVMKNHNKWWFQDAIKKSIRAYENRNGVPPKRVFFYCEDTRRWDLTDDFFSSIERKYSCKFCFISVSKGSDNETRFFTSSGANLPVGTVMDEVVKDKDGCYTFHIVSHSVKVGTVVPLTTYRVEKDDSGLTPDRLKLLTHRLCHLDYRCPPGTPARVPAVCGYADKLASLVANVLHEEPREDLEELLYFL